MKKLIAAALLVGSTLSVAQAQSESNFRVKYMVTYEVPKKLFTAWVIPEYNTPNQNNGDTEERGVTAQFSIKAPNSFVLSGIQDVKGTWEKQPAKIGGQAEFLRAGADPGFGYYIVGKTPSETTYGEFKQGEPIALFTFTGQGGDPAAVTVLENNDPFVRIADRQLSLNVGGSFYSRSGQASRMTARPLEQFAEVTTIKTVLTDMAQKLKAATPAGAETADEKLVIAYPNPVADVLNVTYFSGLDGADVRVQVIDMKGGIKQSGQHKAKWGFNTVQVNMAASTGGMYLLKTTVGDKVVTKKILKDS